MSSLGFVHLLARWQEAYERGQDLPVKELCPDRPEIHGELRQCIDIVRRMNSRGDAAVATATVETVAPRVVPEAATAQVVTVAPETLPPRQGQPCGGIIPGAGGPIRYRILRSHARGGLGEVFLAEDLELRREVALKEIQGQYADDPGSRARFVLEAEVTGRLEHPGIVPVYGLGVYRDGRPFYAMRFIQGQSLRDAIAEYHQGPRDARPLALRQLLTRFVGVCNAVAYAHNRGVLHRDLKPDNVMLGSYGETLVVDWGLAKLVGTGEEAGERRAITPSVEVGQTQAGSVVGTPGYMSPEQAGGEADRVGAASDVYSLGAILYHLLVGRPPFTDRDFVQLLMKTVEGDFVRPRQADRTVPAALEAVCLKAMATRPEGRYASAREVAADVERWLADEPVTARREGVGERLRRWGRRNRAWVQAAGMSRSEVW